MWSTASAPRFTSGGSWPQFAVRYKSMQMFWNLQHISAAQVSAVMQNVRCDVKCSCKEVLQHLVWSQLRINTHFLVLRLHQSISFLHIRTEIPLITSSKISCAGGHHNMPPPPASWLFDPESGVWVTCDVGYICANFSLPNPLYSRLRPDVRNRQTDIRCTSSLNAPYTRGRGIIK